MNILAVDDEPHALAELERAIISAAPRAKLACFLNAESALKYARENVIDIAFVDVQMPGLNGFKLAEIIKETDKNTNIIFVTAFMDYSVKAFEMHASGYVVKPFRAERIAHEINNLRHPRETVQKGIYVQCFGNFEVFCNGEPLAFKRSKSKEVFAYLVDRCGALVTKQQIAAVVMESEEYSRGIQSYLHTLLSHMTETLKNAGGDGVIIRQWGSYAVDPARFNCDYYDFRNGSQKAIGKYNGEYMSNYSWAELTAGGIRF